MASMRKRFSPVRIKNLCSLLEWQNTLGSQWYRTKFVHAAYKVTRCVFLTLSPTAARALGRLHIWTSVCVLGRTHRRSDRPRTARVVVLTRSVSPASFSVPIIVPVFGRRIRFRIRLINRIYTQQLVTGTPDRECVYASFLYGIVSAQTHTHTHTHTHIRTRVYRSVATASRYFSQGCHSHSHHHPCFRCCFSVQDTDQVRRGMKTLRYLALGSGVSHVVWIRPTRVTVKRFSHE